MTRTRVSLLFPSIVLSLLLVTPLLLAQVDRAELEGTVTDPSGRVIVGASVKALAVDTGISQVQPTNAKGYYRFRGLSVGGYTVTVSNKGFATKVIADVTLQVGQTHTLDVALTVSALMEKVEVHDTPAPAERSSAEASTVISTNQIANLPNNGRDWASFALLAPFAQDDGGGDQRTIRFAGRARDDNNFQFDGVDAGGIQEQAKNHKRVCRFLRMQWKSIALTAPCMMRNTERRQAARSMWLPNQERTTSMAQSLAISEILSSTRVTSTTSISTANRSFPRFAWGSTD